MHLRLSNSWKRESAVLICANCNSGFHVKELEGAFNQEKALVGAFSMIGKASRTLVSSSNILSSQPQHLLTGALKSS